MNQARDSDEFDYFIAEQAANELSGGSWLSDKGIAFVDGAKWYHEKHKTELIALKERIRELENKRG